MRHIRKVRNKFYYFLPDPKNGEGRWYEEYERLALKRCIKGRATRVFYVKPIRCNNKREREDDDASSRKSIRSSTSCNVADEPMQGHSEDVSVDGADSSDGGTLNYNAKGYDTEVWNDIAGDVWSTSQNLKPLPSSPVTISDEGGLIVKDSYPPDERAGEEYRMFKSVEGHHGFPNLSHNISSLHRIHILAALPDIVKCPDASQVYSKNVELKPEQRPHLLLTSTTLGTSFRKVINDPKKCARATLDVIIGMCLHSHDTSTTKPYSGLMILHVNKWQHRDISSGNILIFTEETVRDDFVTKPLPEGVREYVSLFIHDA